MNILGFDTSSAALTVACWSGPAARVAESTLEGPLQHAENLFRLMEGTLAGIKSSLSEIDAYGIGTGPGSFTGLRIGFSILKGLLTVHPAPVYGLSSLDLIARGVSGGHGRLAVVVNARRGRLYTAFYRLEAGDLVKETADDELLSPESFVRRCEGGEMMVGDALAEYSQTLREALPQAIFIGEEFWYPRAGHLVRFIASRYNSMKPLEASALRPRYLRLSEAEEKTFGNFHAPHPSH